MPNPGGGNQFGNYTIQPAYGDVKKETQLTREAPISGSPFAQQALETPRRNQKAATRPKKTATQAPVAAPPAAMPQPQAGPSPALFQSIAAIPGASPLVRSIFGG